MYISAQINLETKICYAIVRSREIIESDNAVNLEVYDRSIIGKRWTGSNWEEVPEPTPEEPTA